jgi:hypothetical protein
VRSIPSDRAVIFGGDLNALWSERPWAKALWDSSGLTDVMIELKVSMCAREKGRSCRKE